MGSTENIVLVVMRLIGSTDVQTYLGGRGVLGSVGVVKEIHASF